VDSFSNNPFKKIGRHDNSHSQGKETNWGAAHIKFSTCKFIPPTEETRAAYEEIREALLRGIHTAATQSISSLSIRGIIATKKCKG
jgi:hypothetical protein